MYKLVYVIMYLFVCLSSVQAFELNSNEKQPVLIELYTSEGCSSCPPADRWLKTYMRDPNLWKSVIPMAFHVDYWDYIGWKDKLALKQNSQRQRRFKSQQLATAVYTPEIIKNGHEWRYKKTATTNKNKTSVKLRLNIDKNKVNLYYQGKEQDITYHFVILGFDIHNQIKAGENEGKTLSHQFVVLNHQKKKTNKLNHIQFKLKSLKTKVKRYAVAAWVEKNNQQVPLQAIAGWLPKAISNLL